MQDLDGKIAVVTGGASGIGYGMAVAFADAGMKVVIADIEGAKAEAVAREVGGLAVVTDVTSLDSVTALRDAALEAYGRVDVLCNNAGISLRVVPLDELTDADWEWILKVNLDGVVNGLLAFLPGLKAQGSGHIVNTSSMAGMVPIPGLGAYVVTKYAVCAISDVLRLEAGAYGVGVSVLCPGNVNTGILESERNRPAELADTASTPLTDDLRTEWANSLDPKVVGVQVRDAIRRNDAYIYTHVDTAHGRLVHARLQGVLAAFDR